MSINDFILLIAIFDFILVFYVWKANPKNKLNTTFAVFAFLVGLWVLLNFLFGVNPTITLLELNYIIGPFIITSMFLWVNFLFHQKITRRFLVFFVTLSFIDLCFL